MYSKLLSAHHLRIVCFFCGCLRIAAQPADVEDVLKVAPENLPTMSKGTPVVEEWLRFPQISLGHIHQQTIQVRNVPEMQQFAHGNIPTFIVIDVPYKEAAARFDARWQPWQGAKCRIQMKTLQGTVFYDQTVDVTRDWNGSHWGLITEEDRGGTIQILPSLPKAKEAGLYDRYLTNYDIVIHVLTSSRRPTDSFQFNQQLIGIKPRAQ